MASCSLNVDNHGKPLKRPVVLCVSSGGEILGPASLPSDEWKAAVCQVPGAVQLKKSDFEEALLRMPPLGKDALGFWDKTSEGFYAATKCIRGLWLGRCESSPRLVRECLDFVRRNHLVKEGSELVAQVRYFPNYDASVGSKKVDNEGQTVYFCFVRQAPSLCRRQMLLPYRYIVLSQGDQKASYGAQLAVPLFNGDACILNEWCSHGEYGVFTRFPAGFSDTNANMEVITVKVWAAPSNSTCAF